MTQHAPAVQAGLDRNVHDNLRRLALVAGITFSLFAIMHVTPLGSGLASQIWGNVVGAGGLLGLWVYLRRRETPVPRPNAWLAGAFVWILAGDAFLTWTEHSAASLNVGLFIMMLAGAMILSWPPLVLTLSVAAAEGIFVASLVPNGHIPTQIALEAAAFTLALVIHLNRVGAHARLEALVIQEEERRQEIERAMREVSASEERFRRLADSSFEGLIIHENGKFLDLNRAAAELFGYSADELRGRDPLLVMPEAEHERVLARIAQPTDEPWQTIGLRKDGSTFPMLVSGRYLPFEGRTVRVVAVRDLTDRQRAEEATQDQTVARRIVRRALHAQGSVEPRVLAQRRELGRSIAREANAPTLEKGLATFAAMGLGDLWFVGQEGNRWTFAGHDLLDLDPGARMPSCALALGYVEGLLMHLTGSETMGAELACESQGHAECRFVALVRSAEVTTPSGAVPKPAATRP
jgi:PAS domain S-box-containing protein